MKSFDEKKWQAEEDAITLARYQEIMSDSKRKASAISQMKQQINDMQKRTNAMKKALGGSIKRKK